MWREGREGTVKKEEHCWAKVEEIPTGRSTLGKGVKLETGL